MSWLSKLVETYHAAVDFNVSKGQYSALTPLNHIQQNAHVNIIIDNDGNIIDAVVMNKEKIFLPCTDKSMVRTSGKTPHPLSDKLCYIAKDLSAYSSYENYYSMYSTLLEDWAFSKFGHPALQSVFKYVSKGQVIQDLVSHGVLFEKDGQIVELWEEEGEAPAIFKVLPKEKKGISISGCLVCWTVEGANLNPSQTWNNVEIQKRWVEYQNNNNDAQGLCYVCGEIQPLADKHPSNIRRAGDKAKLVSSNDSTNYTYRGMFSKPEQIAKIGKLASLQAHSALKMLASDRDHIFINDEQTFITWAVKSKNVVTAFTDPFSFFDSEEEQAFDHGTDLGKTYAQQLKKRMYGFNANLLDAQDTICVLGLEAPTTGRLSVIYYREYEPSDYLDNISKWFTDMSWPQRSTNEQKSNSKMKNRWVVSSPAIYKIFDAVYGDILLSNQTLKRNITQRLLSCIIDDTPIPIDIVNNAFRRATNPNSYANDSKWLWEQNVGIACSLIKAYFIRNPISSLKKEYPMSLDANITNRDYLYGRLLAIAENIESFALYKASENRSTTAEKFMQRFADRPFSTWRTIELQLQPYMNRLQSSAPGFIKVRKDDLDKVMDAFQFEDFKNDKALSSEFLLGFHAQRVFYANKINANNELAQPTEQ